MKFHVEIGAESHSCAISASILLQGKGKVPCTVAAALRNAAMALRAAEQAAEAAANDASIDSDAALAARVDALGEAVAEVCVRA